MDKVPQIQASGHRPSLSAATAYKVCAKLRRMMRDKGDKGYEAKYIDLQRITNNTRFEKAVRTLLTRSLGYSPSEAEQWMIAQNIKH